MEVMVKMEKKQEINCTVATCKYNNNQKGKCNLTAIQVEPVAGYETMEADESICASYENIED